MTVRRVRRVIETYDLGALRLYREDLRAIAAAVAEAGDLSILCDGMTEATSPEDFDDPKLPERLSSVQFTVTRKEARFVSPEMSDEATAAAGSRQVASVLLSGREATVALADPDTLLAGVLQRVRLVCEGRRRRLASLVPPQPSRLGRETQSSRSRPGRRSWWLTFVLLIGFVVSLSFAPLMTMATIQPTTGTTATIQPTTPQGALIVLAVAAIFLLGAIAALVLERRPRAVIINAMRADRPTYWQRTRDIWQVGIATAILGAVVGYVLGKFT